VIDAVLTAALLGFFAGIVPGPYTTVVASTGLERGFKPAFRLAFVPLVTDIPPLLIMSMILDRVNYDVLTAVGILGGLLFAYLGVRFIRRQGRDWEEKVEEVREGRAFWALASAGLLSPAPWIFWLVAGSPLLLRAWNQHWSRGVAFALVLFLMLIGTASALAWAASHGQRILNPDRRRRVLRLAGGFLVVAGVVMVWQSWEGNFQRMIKQQELLRERVQEISPRPPP
jgi:threonine/homoserine/homoserine lactone efflux protein